MTEVPREGRQQAEGESDEDWALMKKVLTGYPEAALAVRAAFRKRDAARAEARALALCPRCKGKSCGEEGSGDDGSG